MEPRAPAVVAVVVTRDPGPWFEEVLAALAAQDYEELSVLVLVSGGTEDPSERVARTLPSAFVRRLEEDRGFGAAVDEALRIVDGAGFFLLCHDDCVAEPNAVRDLVEESFRSNAGIVCPKIVRWDDSRVLLHVGMGADKTGAAVERVNEGEIDVGQHDSVRDVFSAPGGFTLVRADLLRELGGYDPDIVALADDLELSWRARLVGARVMVAPAARVRHLEALAGGLRAPANADGEAGTLQELQRRHELRAVLTCYSRFSLVRVLPQAAVLALGELLVSVLAGDRARARAVWRAWVWNLRRAGTLRRRRAVVNRQRRVPDSEVRQLQVHGSSRLSTYVARAVHQGLDVAHGRTPAVMERAGGGQLEEASVPTLTGSVGTAFSEDATFDELDDLGRRAGRDTLGRRQRWSPLVRRRSRLVVWLVAAAVLVIGTRDLFAGGFPVVGQLVPFLSWTHTWHIFFSGWQPAGVGSTAPGGPAFGLMGVSGIVLLGGMGLLQKVLVLGCIPLGAWGVARLVRPICSPRGRLLAAVAYLGLALPYDALSQGRWDGLVAYAAMPWIVARLARASRLEPYGQVAGAGPPWRGGLVGQAVTLGVVEAVAVSFAPGMVPVALLAAAGLLVGSAFAGDVVRTLRVAAVAGGAALMAGVVLLPWVVSTLAAGGFAAEVFGVASSPSASASFADLLRFSVGPVGNSALGWLLVAAAALPLLVARRSRLTWAGCFWVMASASWLLALCVDRGWTGAFAPSVEVLLAPAAVGIAASVGLGVAAFENDLSGYRFGWRQAAVVCAALSAFVGVLPVVVEARSGRWSLPAAGYAQTVPAQADPGGARTLWLGDPRVLPGGGWEIQPGLAYATSEETTPNAGNLWLPADPGPAVNLSRAVELAVHSGTSHLGRLLAPAGVRDVVVVQSLGPRIAGGASPLTVTPPPDLVPALDAQGDLQPVPSTAGGYQLFSNTEYVPVRAERRAGPVTAATWPTTADVTGWRGALPGEAGSDSYSGQLRGGTVLSGYAPSSQWVLDSGGRAVPGRVAFGWARQFTGVPAGTASLEVVGTTGVTVGIAIEFAFWVLVVGVLLGRRRSVDWWLLPIQSRRTAQQARRTARRARPSHGAEADRTAPSASPPPRTTRVSRPRGLLRSARFSQSTRTKGRRG